MHVVHRVGLIALALTLPLVGCDSDDEITIPIQRFAAPLASVNATVALVTGTSDFEIVADAMRVRVSASGVNGAMTLQFTGTGTACPTAAQDTNQDGFIDIVEAQTVTGPFLLALDSNLAVRPDSLSQLTGFPTGNPIAFSQTAVLSAVENSLRGAPTSQFVTNLPVNGDFNPEGQTILLLGTNASVPPTVAALPGFTAAQSLPVACGVIQRVLL